MVEGVHAGAQHCLLLQVHHIHQAWSRVRRGRGGALSNPSVSLRSVGAPQLWRGIQSRGAHAVSKRRGEGGAKLAWPEPTLQTLVPTQQLLPGGW